MLIRLGIHVTLRIAYIITEGYFHYFSHLSRGYSPKERKVTLYIKYCRLVQHLFYSHHMTLAQYIIETFPWYVLLLSFLSDINIIQFVYARILKASNAVWQN